MRLAGLLRPFLVERRDGWGRTSTALVIGWDAEANRLLCLTPLPDDRPPYNVLAVAWMSVADVPIVPMASVPDDLTALLPVEWVKR